MKKFFLITCLAALMHTGRAQQASQAILPDNMKWMHISSGYSSSIHIRAVRDFLKRTKSTPCAEWAAVNNGFVVKYVVNDRRCRTVYNKRGDFLYTIRQYAESQMTKESRTAVKSRYFDYEITLVEEIERPSQPLTYVVHLEDATTIINVQVKDGEVELVEEFTKG
jgi:hypothetical protein